jgi:hypothetical protein
MAVSLSSSLLAHQAGARRLPALSVAAAATRAGVEILRWERRYAGSEPADPFACVITIAGTLLRARNQAGSLEIARTVTPGDDAALFDDWTPIGAVSADTPVGMAAHGAETLLISCSNAGKTIEARSSTDDGLSWSSATSIVTEPLAIGALAAAFTPAGDACIFYVAGTGADLQRLRRTSGAWAAAGTSWTKSALVDSLTGIGACHDAADFVLALTGTEATTLGRRAWTVRMGDGGLPSNSWSGLTVLAEADAASTVSFEAPAILARDGDFHALVTRRESGHVEAAATLTMHPLHLAGSGSAWTEPVPVRDAAGGALSFADVAEGYAWAASAAEVYRAQVGVADDLTGRLLACDWDLTLTSARASLEFDDAEGSLSGDGTVLVPGNTLSLHHGYLSGAAGMAEFGIALEFTITSVVCKLSNGTRRLLVDADGPWEQLARWHAPDSWQASTADTRDTIFTRITSRAGVLAAAAAVPLAPPAEWDDTAIAFALTPGEGGSAALRRLMSGIEVAAVPSGGSLIIRGLDLDEAPAWQIGGAAGHPADDFESLAAQHPGWLRLQGVGRYADAFDATVETSEGVIHDSSATTDESATAHASAIFRHARAIVPRARLTLPFHAGIEIGDVVVVTGPIQSFDATPLRVIALAMRFGRGPRGARYDSLLTLGDV